MRVDNGLVVVRQSFAQLFIYFLSFLFFYNTHSHTNGTWFYQMPHWTQPSHVKTNFNHGVLWSALKSFGFFTSALNFAPLSEIQCLWILKVMEKMLCWQATETQGHVFPHKHKSRPPLAPCPPFSRICSRSRLLAISTDWEAWFMPAGEVYSRKFN